MTSLTKAKVMKNMLEDAQLLVGIQLPKLQLVKLMSPK